MLGEGRTGVSGTSAIKGEFVPNAGVRGESTVGDIGVWGNSPTGSGVWGIGALGGYFQGSIAPLRLGAAQTAGPPSGHHEMGELYVDSGGTLYYCQAAGTPGTWRRVQLG